MRTSVDHAIVMTLIAQRKSENSTKQQLFSFRVIKLIWTRSWRAEATHRLAKTGIEREHGHLSTQMHHNGHQVVKREPSTREGMGAVQTSFPGRNAKYLLGRPQQPFDRNYVRVD